MSGLLHSVWKFFDGKKLWTTLSTILGYGIAQLQLKHPDCLPVGSFCVPWEILLPILAVSGITVGVGHKIVKRFSRNGALFVLFGILTFAPIVSAQPTVHYYIGERLNVLEGIRPGLTRELITKAARAGCDGIVGLDQWSKNGDPRSDLRWRDSMHVICRLCDSLGLELRPLVWNGSKFAYGCPDGIETLAPIGSVHKFDQAFVIAVGQRKFMFFQLPEEFSHRLFSLNLSVTGAPARVQFFRDTPGQELVSKYVAQPGTQALAFHSLDNSTGWFIYLAPAGNSPTRILLQNLSERAPTVTEAPTYSGGATEYSYIGEDGRTSFYLSRTMNPDCTAAFYGKAMRQSLMFWQEFQREPAIAGVWLSLDEVSVCTNGEAYSDMVKQAAWYNYSLWGKDSWGWNDCLGGHNSQSLGPGPRATFDMLNDGPDEGTPFLGFAWNESKPAALRNELALFECGTVGAAVFLGTNNIDSAAAAIQDHGVEQVLLFNWQYQTWIDSLPWIVSKIKYQRP